MAKKTPGHRKPKSEPSDEAPRTLFGPPPPSADAGMRDLSRLLSEQTFKDADEANAFIKNLLESTGGFLTQSEPETDLELAQEIMYEAFEERSKTKRIKLAREALELSIDCADAYLLLGAEAVKTDAETRAYFEAAVRAGERAIGPDFQSLRGQFWHVFATRPYMRARQALAFQLLDMGETAEAAEQMMGMILLNPNDNLGVRDTLYSLLLEINDKKRLVMVLKMYKGDWSASWHYSSALHLFREQRANGKANDALRQAIERNRFVPRSTQLPKSSVRFCSYLLTSST